jgi:hypothetical protein
MTPKERSELLTCVTFFLRNASDESLYFNGYSSKEAWDAFAKLMYNVSGDELYKMMDVQF